MGDLRTKDVINRYFTTMAQLDALVKKVAAAQPSLETFELRMDDEDAISPPLMRYLAKVDRGGGSAVEPRIVNKVRKVDQDAMEELLESFATLSGMDYLAGMGGAFGNGYF